MAGSDSRESTETDWLSANDAYRLVLKHNGSNAAISIAQRAHVGLLRTSAVLFRKEDPAQGGKRIVDHHKVELPTRFWWATGHAALTQDWRAGDFSTWIDHEYHWQAFGVKFERAGIERILAPAIEPAISFLQPDEALSQVEPPKCDLPSDAEIKAKMLELHEMGIGRDAAAKVIKQIAGFEGVGNEHARRVVANALPKGRKPRR